MLHVKIANWCFWWLCYYCFVGETISYIITDDIKYTISWEAYFDYDNNDIDDNEIFYFSSSLVRSILCWTPLFHLYNSKKSVDNLFILVNSGFHSHRFQYMQNAHTDVWTFAISRKPISICGRLNLSLIKQMLIYVCRLSVVLCHRQVVVRFYVCFNRPNVVDTFSGLTSRRGDARLN